MSKLYKKDFQAFANILKSTNATDLQKRLFASHLAQYNEAFKEKTFLKACGVE